MLLSIIIVNYNAKKVLIDCLNSVKNSFPANKVEVFVIDNASEESIAELIDLFSCYHFIVNKVNLGFAAANNIGISRSNGEFVLLLNPDTIVNKDSFQPMITYLCNNPKVGIVGCKIFNNEGQIERSTHSFPTIAKEFIHANEFLKSLINYDSVLGKVIAKFFRLKSFESYWDHNSVKEVDHVTGACMMVKKEVIQKAGLLDEAFFLYNEEVEWSYRIKKAGYTSVFLPESTIIHLFGYSTKQQVQKQKVNKLLVERYRGMFYFFQKHFGMKLPILRVIVFEGFLIRLIIKYFKLINLKNNRAIVIDEIKYIKNILKIVFENNYDWRKR